MVGGSWPSACQICGRVADEYCPDGNCRSCHVSVGWDDCVTGTWNARMLLANGHARDEVLRLYPEAENMFPAPDMTPRDKEDDDA